MLPAWFRVLSATVGPAEYVQRNRYNSQVSLRARAHQDARRGAENCDPDVTPGFAETVSPGERSIDPFILFVVFLVCRYFSRCHDYFGQILDSDGTVLLCLHKWGAHEHPSLMNPDHGTPGNGLLLFFRVDDFELALQRARSLTNRFEEEPHLNSNTRTKEFSLRDPDGYYVTISALSAA